MGVPTIGQTTHMELPVRTWLLTFKYKRFPGNSAGKESSCNVGDPGYIPGSGRSAEEGIGYPLQYSGLENSIDCIVHGVTKSRTRQSEFHVTLSQNT